jgi:hypothetical protein
MRLGIARRRHILRRQFERFRARQHGLATRLGRVTGCAGGNGERKHSGRSGQTDRLLCHARILGRTERLGTNGCGTRKPVIDSLKVREQDAPNIDNLGGGDGANARH